MWHSTHDGLYERCFSTAIGADDADEIVVVDIEINTTQGGISVVGNIYIAE